jgi:hypothetical protein
MNNIKFSKKRNADASLQEYCNALQISVQYNYVGASMDSFCLLLLLLLLLAFTTHLRVLASSFLRLRDHTQ